MSPPPDEHDEPFDLLEPLDDRSGPAQPLSAEKASAMVSGVLSAHFAPVSPAQPAPVAAPVAAPRPWFVTHTGWMVGAGAGVVVGAMAAGVWWTRQSPPPSEPPRVAEVRPAPAEPLLPTLDPPPPAVVPMPVEVPPATPAPVAKSPARPTVEPEDLLRRANERRAEGQWQAAESLYLKVLQSSPGTESAYVALVASGGLRVEHLDDARGALRQYQQALRLRPRGALGEEAHHGVAKAWRALGDAAQEAHALEDFLAAHPESLRAGAVKERLRQLASPPP